MRKEYLTATWRAINPLADLFFKHNVFCFGNKMKRPTENFYM